MSSEFFPSSFHASIRVHMNILADSQKSAMPKGEDLCFIGKCEIIDAHSAGEIAVNLIGRSNKCGVTSPRFDKQHKDPVPLPSVLFHCADNSSGPCTMKKQDQNTQEGESGLLFLGM